MLSVVIPLRNRPLVMLERTVTALRWQGYEAEIVVVSNGNTKVFDKTLQEFCSSYLIKLVQVNTGVWNKSRTSNIGLRATSSTSEYLMTMDIDILLEPNFFNELFTLKNLSKRFVLCQVGELADGVVYPTPLTPEGYHDLKSQAYWPAPTHGIGGIQFASRKFFFDVHGYDEDMIYWGSMDSDMADRAVRYGLKKTWLNNRTSMLHQPHVKKGKILTSDELRKDARKAHTNNRRLRHSRKKILVRNPNGWGKS